MDHNNQPRAEISLGLALSGGGSRAIAFHLGCLRALNEVGLLPAVRMMSSVSGGSVIAALYCSHQGDFDSFERTVRSELERGFVKPAVRAAVTTLEGIRALANFVALLVERSLAALVRLLLRPLGGRQRSGSHWPYVPAVRRFASRTTLLRSALNRTFSGRRLSDLRADRPSLFVVACELRAKAAFYFTSTTMHCWRYGSSPSEPILLSHAVAASAAYPLALPAIDGTYRFMKHGVATSQRVSLTDGGVYDNLGLAPFWPDRDPSISLSGPPVDRLIVCRAGYGLAVEEPEALLLGRMAAAFESVFARSQNAAVARLFDLVRSGAMGGAILAYLGQDDSKLGDATANLVSADEVKGYPTNFSAMSDAWIDAGPTRG